MAPGTVSVISTMGMPPAATAWAAKWASSVEETRIAGMIPISLMRAQTSSLFIMETFRFATEYERLCGLLRFHYRKLITAAGKPYVEGGQEKDAHHEVGNRTADDYDRKRPL